MQIQNAIRLIREVCALRHLSLNTEKSYCHWLCRFGSFLKDQKLKTMKPETKMEAFLTRLAITGVSASTQNQAFNALLFFYRDVLKQELGPVDSLRARRPVTTLQCPSQEEVNHLLTTVADVYRYPMRNYPQVESDSQKRKSGPEVAQSDFLEGKFGAVFCASNSVFILI